VNSIGVVGPSIRTSVAGITSLAILRLLGFELGFRTDVRKIAHPTDKSNAKALVEGFEASLGLQYWQASRRWVDTSGRKKWM
jgi:hypothetical protein